MMKYLCPDCWPKMSGPWLCNPAWSRDLNMIPRFPKPRHLLETDSYSLSMA